MTRGDDLGRVVIPKEIRRTMRIREGEPLEIHTDVETFGRALEGFLRRCSLIETQHKKGEERNAPFFSFLYNDVLG